jgi:hypothetical protein
MGGHSKLTKKERNRAIARGLQKHARRLEGLVLDGEPVDVAVLVTRLRAHVAKLDAIDALEGQRREAVAEERAIEAELRPKLVSLRKILANMLGNASPMLIDFGFEPYGKPGPKSVAAKVEGAKKAKATREKRGTMGKRQRQKIKG